MSSTLKGRKQTPEHIARRTASMKETLKKKPEGWNSGKNNPTWKGGISKDHLAYQRHWRDIKKGYYKNYFIGRKETLANRKKPDSCEVCGAIGQICFDHNHKTGAFRGWICTRCNLILGMAKDSSELLTKLSEYLS
jgi:hypothetical protein